MRDCVDRRVAPLPEKGWLLPHSPEYSGDCGEVTPSEGVLNRNFFRGFILNIKSIVLSI